MASELKQLTPQQRLAAEPDVHAWVSASAGTGKTQVLSARVLRLLIGGARPEGVVALTFTKAAAAEMQNRILDVLGRWVTAPDEVIAGDLRAIGAASDTETLRRARTLFARALEVHGGFRVQTLHSFASSLLAAFPIEAGVTPGYATLDDRSGAQLKRQVLEDAIEEAAADGDAAFLDDLGSLAVRHGDAGAAQMMAALLAERRKLLHLDSAEATQAAVRAFLKLPLQGSREEVLARTIEERTGLMETLRTYGRALEAWNTKTGTDRLVQLRRFIDCEPGGRCFEMGSLFAAVFKDGGKGDVLGNMKKVEAELNAAAEHAEALRDTVWRLEVAEVAALHLRVGSRLAARYGEAKQRLGAVDFDDLIAEAADLLQRVPGAWVLYKLDQRIEHLLVDEGQDTNAAQWRIVHALTAEFFAGEGAREERRTQFAVGDFKQAIFGFQGTDPEEFRKARAETAARARGVRHPFEDVPLNRSFRSVPAVLTVVDKVLEMKGPAALGMDGEVLPHEPDRNAAGAVTLWPKLWDGEQDEPPDVKEEKDRILAGNIAREVRGWLDAGLFVPSKERSVQPQDVLILVRTPRSAGAGTRRRPACRAGAGRRRRPAAVDVAAGGSGLPVADPLCVAAGGRPVASGASGVALPRLVAGRALPNSPSAAASAACGASCARRTASVRLKRGSGCGRCSRWPIFVRPMPSWRRCCPVRSATGRSCCGGWARKRWIRWRNC